MSDTANTPWRKRAAFELAAVTAMVVSYVWYWQGHSLGIDVLVALAVLLLLWTSHRVRRETPRAIGFRVDNLGRAGLVVFAFVAPLLLALAGAGLVLGLHREWPIPGLAERALSMLAFGVLQQYLLLGFYLPRFDELIPGKLLPALAAAMIFAALHAPAPWLIAVTFLAGLGASWLFQRAANLWILGVAHGLLSLTVAMFLAKLLPAGLKVGLRALG